MAAAAALALAIAPPLGAEWKTGAAKVNITPERALWLAGYSGRDHAAEGKLTDLWAKALAFEDGQGRRAVLITLDLIGLDRELSESICNALHRAHGLSRPQVAICASHTHTGPVVGKNLAPMHYEKLNAQQRDWTAKYAETLRGKIVQVVGHALAGLEVSRLSWGSGLATFAVNRRNNREPEVPRLRRQGALVGPSDHDVPVLAVHDSQDALRAVVFGYACHATVLDLYLWSGDYPGFAQAELEARHPGCVAMFWAGCGADQNPVPRRTVELARHYGSRLAAAVDSVLLTTRLTPVADRIETRFMEVPLPLDTLPQTYPYPIGIWRIGDDISFITLGGEVVVDYALRLKGELGGLKTWVAGTSHDVMAYIPSRRVWEEGGYEGADAMAYYGLPARWAADVEEAIVTRVVAECRSAAERCGGQR